MPVVDPYGLIEALRDYYSRDGLEATHERTLELLGRLLVVDVISSEKVFEELCKDAQLFLVAAWQMGRAAADCE